MSTLTGWSEAFDARKTPSAVGKISEKFRQRKGAYRSLHPVHSVAALGRHAEYITSGHELCETGCGQGTPYMKMRELVGKVLLLGVDMDRNTVMHTLEELAGACYLRTVDIPAPAYIEGYKGKTIKLKKFPPGHRDFIGITPLLRRRGLITEGSIGNAVVKVIKMQELFSSVLELLSEDPMLFICHNENCNSCHWSRLLYSGSPVDYSIYRSNGCIDGSCEICVVP